jgi:hypothetical protein
MIIQKVNGSLGSTLQGFGIIEDGPQTTDDRGKTTGEKNTDERVTKISSRTINNTP